MHIPTIGADKPRLSVTLLAYYPGEPIYDGVMRYVTVVEFQ